MRILFAFYPLYVQYNYGIALLSALCKGQGITTGLYVLDDVTKFRAYLVANPVPTVAFSCVVEADYLKCFPFMQVAREEKREVLLGGVYPRRVRNLVPPVDLICHGEGEFLPYYLLSPEAGWIFTRPQKPFFDINDLPLPDYELFKEVPFNRDFPWARDKNILPYSSSRGCPFRCSFCETRTQDSKPRIRTRVKEDIEHICKNYAPDIIYFLDELAPIYSDAWRQSWGDFRFPFICYTRADWPVELLEWLIDRGMVGAIFGVESGNEQYRNEVLKKDLLDKHLWRTIEVLEEAGINYAAFFMTGTPGETFQLQAETYRVAETIKSYGGHVVTYQYENLMAG